MWVVKIALHATLVHKMSTDNQREKYVQVYITTGLVLGLKKPHQLKQQHRKNWTCVGVNSPLFSIHVIKIFQRMDKKVCVPVCRKSKKKKHSKIDNFIEWERKKCRRLVPFIHLFSLPYLFELPFLFIFWLNYIDGHGFICVLHKTVCRPTNIDHQFIKYWERALTQKEKGHLFYLSKVTKNSNKSSHIIPEWFKLVSPKH
jgi:hypothetical protein